MILQIRVKRAISLKGGPSSKKGGNVMDDCSYSLSEIDSIVQEAIEHAHCELVDWQQDPRNSYRLFIVARLRSLPPEAAPLQIEVSLPSR